MPVEVICLTHQVFSPDLLLGTPLYPLRLHVSLCLQKKINNDLTISPMQDTIVSLLQSLSFFSLTLVSITISSFPDKPLETNKPAWIEHNFRWKLKDTHNNILLLFYF